MQYYRGSLPKPKSSPPLPGIGSVNPDAGGSNPHPLLRASVLDEIERTQSWGFGLF